MRHHDLNIALKGQSHQDLVLLENPMKVLPGVAKTHCTDHESCLKLVWLRTAGRKEVV